MWRLNEVLAAGLYMGSRVVTEDTRVKVDVGAVGACSENRRLSAQWRVSGRRADLDWRPTPKSFFEARVVDPYI